MIDRSTFLLGSLGASIGVTTRTAAQAPISLEMLLLPSGTGEVLAPITARLGIRNRTGKVFDVIFPNAETFLLEIVTGETTLWSSAYEHKPIEFGRTISVAPGLFALANYVIEGTTNDRHALGAGTYTLRAQLLGKTLKPIVERTLTYTPPLPIERANKAKSGTTATIVGTPTIEKGVTTLTDGTGSIRLTRALGLGAVGIYAVHGYVDTSELGIQFAVNRFLPLRDPDEKADVAPTATPKA